MFMIRKSALTFLLFPFLLSSPFTQAKTALPKKSMHQQDSPSITVITLNMANYNGHADWPDRLKLMVDAIENAHADIVALQEVSYNPDAPSSQISFQNMAEQVLYQLNQRGDFLSASLVTQPAMYYPSDSTLSPAHNYVLPAALSSDNHTYHWEGISIISKYKITETGSYFLTQGPTCDDTNKRATQYAKVDLNGQPLYVVNVHFGLGTQCISTNIQETVNYIQTMSASAPLLLLGDFNATPDNPDLSNFTTAGLIDVWKTLHPNDNGYTFASDNPYKRIDYIWANASMASKLTAPQQIWLIGDNKNSAGVYPSDHLGIALNFKN